MATRCGARKATHSALFCLALLTVHGADVERELTDADSVLAMQRKLSELVLRLETPPELPTVVLVGHHNDGKSALLEALAGVRLTHVGSSTTTRRPLRVHLQHDPSLSSPVFFLAHAGGEELPCSIREVRAYIEAENDRLAHRAELDETCIEVRMRWRHAINVVLIDTPGLLSIPAKSVVADAELQRRSDEVEQIVLRQTASPFRLILCLEDTSDWQLARTHPIVQRVDPRLSRTVLVATKLDAKIAQFSMPEDLHRLLNPRQLFATYKGLLAGPIFTSIPPARTNEQGELPDLSFATELEEHEASIRDALEERLGSNAYSSRIGVSALRRAIEPAICSRWIQLHAQAAKAIDVQLKELQRRQLEPARDSYESLEDFAHRYSNAISALLKGSVAVEASAHGETLEQERQVSGSGALCTLSRPSAEERKRATAAGPAPGALNPEALASMGAEETAMLWMHAGMRLYGGAQYWRALREFSLGAAEVPDSELTMEEIVNAMGFDGYHDGVNYLRAVCIIVLQRAKGFFEVFSCRSNDCGTLRGLPLATLSANLRKLRVRLLHIMNRLCDPVDTLLQAEADGDLLAATSDAQRRNPVNTQAHARHLALANTVYARFIEVTMEDCMEKCMHDVQAMTKYVSWDFHASGRDALYNMLIEPISSRLPTSAGGFRRRGRDRRGLSEPRKGGQQVGSYEELVDGLTEILTSRRVSEPMRLLMNELVREIIIGWREEFCRMISLKFNSFFLMPFCDSLPRYMRRELLRIEKESERALGDSCSDQVQRRQDQLLALQERIEQLSGEKAVLSRIGPQLRRHKTLASEGALPWARFVTKARQRGFTGSANVGNARPV